jgi:hypothetical protein
MVQIADKYFYNGEEYTAKELYKYCRKDITYAAFKSRLNNGWDIEMALIFKANPGNKAELRNYWTISSIYCFKKKGDCASCRVVPEDMKENCQAKYAVPKILSIYGEPNFDNICYNISLERGFSSVDFLEEVKEYLKSTLEQKQELIDYWKSPEREIERANMLEPPNKFYKVLLCYLNKHPLKEAVAKMRISYPVLYNVKRGGQIKQKNVMAKADKFLKKHGYYELYKEEQ